MFSILLYTTQNLQKIDLKFGTRIVALNGRLYTLVTVEPLPVSSPCPP